MSLRVLIGGPSYQYQCDVRRHDHNLALAVALAREGMLLGPCSFVGCPVELARHGVMMQAMGSGADILITSDHDTWVTEPQEVIDAIRYMRAQNAPYIAFPTMKRNGESNVKLLSSPPTWAARSEVQPVPHPVHAVGAAFALHHLGMYRDLWPNGPWFRSTWDGDAMTSEDVWHCEQLRRRMNSNPIVWGQHWAKHADGSRAL